MNLWRPASLKAKLALIGIGLQGLLLFVMTGITLALLDHNLSAELQSRRQQMQPVLQTALIGPMQRGDRPAIQAALQPARGMNHVAHVEVIETGKGTVARVDGSASGDPRYLETIVVPLHDGTRMLGEARVAMSKQAFVAGRQRLVLGMLGGGLVVLLICSALMWLATRTLTRPLHLLVEASRDIRAANYDIDLPANRHDEIGEAMEAFMKMSAEIKRKIAELTNAQAMQKRYLQESRRKQRELETALKQAEAATRAKSEFLANISHEVRTPLNAVLGFTQMLASTPLDERQRSHVSRIRTAGKALLRLINDVLDYSKAEAGRIELSVAPMDLRLLVQRIVGLFGYQSAQNQVALQCRIGPAVAPRLMGDALRIQQVLLNLVGNAMKFTRRGSVTVVLDCIENTPAVQRLRLQVIDTGIGMTTEQKSLVFAAFVQGDGSITRKYGGTGLGLSICKSLVDLMNGTISVDSEPGRGSTFTVELELEVADTAAAPTGFDRLSDFGPLPDGTPDVALPTQPPAEPLLPELGALQPDAEPAPPVVAAPTGPVDRAALAPLFDDLEQRLARNRLSAGTLIEPIRVALGAAASLQTFQELAQDMQALRFAQALERLQQLRTAIHGR